MVRLSKNGPWATLDMRHEVSTKADGRFRWSLQVPDRPRAWIQFETGSTSSNIAEVLINYVP